MGPQFKNSILGAEAAKRLDELERLYPELGGLRDDVRGVRQLRLGRMLSRYEKLPPGPARDALGQFIADYRYIPVEFPMPSSSLPQPPAGMAKPAPAPPEGAPAAVSLKPAVEPAALDPLPPGPPAKKQSRRKTIYHGPQRERAKAVLRRKSMFPDGKYPDRAELSTADLWARFCTEYKLALAEGKLDTRLPMPSKSVVLRLVGRAPD